MNFGLNPSGSQRRRLIPALSLDTPSPARKPAPGAGLRWVDGPLRSAQRGLGEPFEIKVYEIDDVERLQRRRGGSGKVSAPSHTGWGVPPGKSLGQAQGDSPAGFPVGGVRSEHGTQEDSPFPV